MDNDNDNQKPAEVHVSNLSKNVKYGHLKEIFGYYGNIKNIDMNYNNNSANIIYEKNNDAEGALIYMDGGQIDGEILKVSIVLVSRKTNESRRNNSPSRREEIRGRER